MQPDAALHKALAAICLVTALDTERRAATNPIGETVALEDLLHAEERHQSAIEAQRCIEARHGQDDMRHAVDVDHSLPLPLRLPPVRHTEETVSAEA